MFVIYSNAGCTFTYWSHVTEVGHLECNQSYWMVPGTGDWDLALGKHVMREFAVLYADDNDSIEADGGVSTP